MVWIESVDGEGGPFFDDAPTGASRTDAAKRHEGEPPAAPKLFSLLTARKLRALGRLARSCTSFSTLFWLPAVHEGGSGGSFCDEACHRQLRVHDASLRHRRAQARTRLRLVRRGGEARGRVA